MRILISIAVLLGAVFYGISDFLLKMEPAHFIFNPDKLHHLSQQCVQTYGNDTKAMVTTIVDQLRQDDTLAPFLSTDEEWILNNAGGAMGAMYLIHASEQYSTPDLSAPRVATDFFSRHNRIPYNLRHTPGHRRPHRPPHSHGLLQHPLRHTKSLHRRIFRARSLPCRLRAHSSSRTGEAVQNGRLLLRTGVRARLHPGNAAFRVWGWIDEYV